MMGVNFLIALFVLWNNPKSLVHRAFFVWVTGIALWGIGLVLMLETGIFNIYDKVTLYGFLIMIFGSAFFPSVFPRRKTFPSKNYWFFLPIFLLGIALPFNLIIQNAVVANDQIQPVNGPLFPYFAATSLAYVIGGLILFARTYKKSAPSERLQMNYFLLGLSAFLVSAMLCDIILPGFGIYQFNLFGPACSIALTGATAYAIVRHELLDIRIVIQRGLIYAMLFGLVVSIYIALLQSIGYFVGELTNTTTIVSAGATTILGVFFLRPLENYFQKATDKIFFKDKYNYAAALHSLSQILYTSLDEEEIITRSEATLNQIFKTEDAQIVLDPDAVSRLSLTDRSAGFRTLSHPIVFENKAVGVLCLGPKLSGDSYSKQDLQLISTFTFQAAISLGKARLHKEVQEYSSHLEQLVDERTREIKKIQEEQQEAMIDISHNLQTPLAVIKGELELLEEGTDESEKIDAVRNSIDRVSGFIRRLLRVARFEHSLDDVEMIPIDIASLLSEQRDYFEVMAGENGVRIISKTKDVGMILGNKRLLEELFTSIVSNAISYRSHTRTSIISITLDDTDTSIIIHIRDNGIGIAPHHLTRIFDRFYRTSLGESAPQGTGLGLTIAKQITQRHSGSIIAESILGEETTFTITIPKLR